MTIEFDIGGSSFKIVRGIKPNKFEIWQNGNLINQASNVRDYQKFLEQNILKLNHKSFHQVVVLGSSSFVPFMQLPAWSRRQVIEDLLDINIFSKMNMLLKERNAKIREELTDINHQIDIAKTKIDGQSKYIKNLQELNEDQIEKKHESINTHKEEIKNLFDESKVLSKDLVSMLSVEEKKNKNLLKQNSQLESYALNFKSKMVDLVKESKFYEEHDQCPTCDQEITEEKKIEKITAVKAKAKELQTAEQDLNKQISSLKRETTNVTNHINELRQRQTKINSMRKGKDKATEKKLEYVEERTYNEVIGEMLKDTGIKTKVIKQYLPVMNRLINQYLQVLDFFVSFHLDENFDETIRSRHRDSFNYASFSEGEKQRIDLSLLFTWRQIAKMKNSASSNLLVLDETFDSSLDHDGIDNLMKILNTLDDNSNTFIISHKGDVLQDKFRSKIEFFKHKNFSRIR